MMKCLELHRARTIEKEKIAIEKYFCLRNDLLYDTFYLIYHVLKIQVSAIKCYIFFDVKHIHNIKDELSILKNVSSTAGGCINGRFYSTNYDEQFIAKFAFTGITNARAFLFAANLSRCLSTD